MSPMSNDGSTNRVDCPEAADVLDFWFGDFDDPENVKRRRELWFASKRAQDRDIRERFGGLHERAQGGELDAWVEQPQTALALVVLLDQFTRNLYRGTARAFTNDARALELARAGIDRGFDRSLHVVQRAFFYMPFQHSENRDDQAQSVALFEALLRDSPAPFKPFAEDSREYAVLHKEIIERFGRFPHRNELLGRRASEQEKRYLEQGGQRFGQG